jgi:hypothetical protein
MARLKDSRERELSWQLEERSFNISKEQEVQII